MNDTCVWNNLQLFSLYSNWNLILDFFQSCQYQSVLVMVTHVCEIQQTSRGTLSFLAGEGATFMKIHVVEEAAATRCWWEMVWVAGHSAVKETPRNKVHTSVTHKHMHVINILCDSQPSATSLPAVRWNDALRHFTVCVKILFQAVFTKTLHLCF